MNMIWVNSMFMKLQFKPKCQEPGQVCNARSIGGAGCLLQFSDLPPCRWLPLFAHSVNYYQKAVYLGCSPTLLHILWPIIKGDLHYKPWSPSKRATATVSAARPIPAPQHYLSTPSCFVSPIALSLSLSLPLSLPTSFSSHSPNPLAWTCTCWLNCAWQVPHPLALLFFFSFSFFFYNPFCVCIRFLWCGYRTKTVRE